jgi:hypothetical protein
MNEKLPFLNWFQNPIRQGQSHWYEMAGLSEKEKFMSEDQFEKMVILERKKSERSGRPFLLMLLCLDLDKKGDLPSIKTFMRDISLALDYSTREIDVKGWYLNNAVLGILCTDINTMCKELLTNRLYMTLKNSLTVFQKMHLKVYAMLYPDSGGIEQSTSVAFNSPEEFLHPLRYGSFAT